MSMLVVGAGPVGLTLGLALHRQGIAFRHIERASSRFPTSRALAVQARTLEAVAPLGMAELILAAGLRPAGGTIHLGGAAHSFDLTHDLHPRFPSATLLPQSETERLLTERGEALGLPPVERGVELLALDPVTGEVALSHPDGHRETQQFDRVLGCDGAHSAVRKLTGLGFEGGRYEQRFLLADGPAEGLDRARLHLFPGRGGFHFFFPLPDGNWRVVAALPTGAAEPVDGDLAVFAVNGARLTRSVWWSAFNVSHRLASSFHMGRVCIMGDAAHIHSPAGGQGMNIGMQDACWLALALPCGEAAIAEWAAGRRAIAKSVLSRTDTMTRMLLGDTVATRLLRAMAVRLLPLLPPARRRLERVLAGLDYPAFDNA